MEVPARRAGLAVRRSRLWLALLLATTCVACHGPGRSTPELPLGGAEDPYLGHLHWMAGSWVSVDEDTIVEEHWAAPRGGMMVGMARTTVGGRVTFWEFIQIYEDEDRIVFAPWPKGEEGVPFYQTESGPNRVVFANPNNDFPSRIEYTRTGDTLEAVLTGTPRGDERRESWRWQRYDIAD